jgi:hypothetical protein
LFCALNGLVVNQITIRTNFHFILFSTLKGLDVNKCATTQNSLKLFLSYLCNCSTSYWEVYLIISTQIGPINIPYMPARNLPAHSV